MLTDKAVFSDCDCTTSVEDKVTRLEDLNNDRELKTASLSAIEAAPVILRAPPVIEDVTLAVWDGFAIEDDIKSTLD